ncbi:MAG: hypothetical protein OEU97_03835 [Dehalococcoidia bacterium]|nr:hypothetical protein [Dehalococcoidia bacterium]
MFWKHNESKGVNLLEPKEVPELMRQKSVKKEEKLRGPQAIPELVQKYLVAERRMDPDLAKLLKAVMRKSASQEGLLNIRVFDESEALAKKVKVENYTSLDEHQDLVGYEGWVDLESKRVGLLEKKKISADTTIFTEAEILKKIEELGEPGSTAFFYMARGGTNGGPLGMGATVVELDPDYSGEKKRKYSVYSADVVDMKPVGKGNKVFDSNKPKDVARWIKNGHHKRTY